MCCGDHELDMLAGPLRRLMPEFASDPVVQHAGHRLSQCPHLVAEYIERLVAGLPYRPYGNAQADLAAAVLARIGVAPRSDTTLAEIEADVISRFANLRKRNDYEELSLALAKARFPLLKRARFVGLEMASEPPRPAFRASQET